MGKNNNIEVDRATVLSLDFEPRLSAAKAAQGDKIILRAREIGPRLKAGQSGKLTRNGLRCVLDVPSYAPLKLALNLPPVTSSSSVPVRNSKERLAGAVEWPETSGRNN